LEPPGCLAWWHGKLRPGPRGKEELRRELGTRLQWGPLLEPAVPSSSEIPPLLPFPPVLDAALHIELVTPREMKLFLLNLA